MINALQQLADTGVAVWLDDLSRTQIKSGNLAELAAHSGVVGVTTNPTIFAKAIGSGTGYEEQVHDLALRGTAVGETVRLLTAWDVRSACDVLQPTAARTDGRDGRVSIEVDPRIAQDAARTAAEARGLWWLVDRPNLFIKIPATLAGLPAITETLAAWADSSGRRNTLTGVAMNIRKRRSDRSGRVRLFSPGRPPVAGREERRRFWAAIAAGAASEDAAVGVGVPQAVGTRWFRKAGGMPPSMFGLSAKPLCGRYLSFAEREEIALLRVQGYSMQEVARRLGRVASTISRELRRNAATRSGGLAYRATTAQWHAERAARRPKQAKLARNAALRTYVEERLAGVVVAPSGAPVPGPVVSWKSRRHGPRKDRRWANAWSPEQIARRLPVDFADDATMRISHEAIYQALFVQGRGALRRELTACLRTGRVLRMPRARTRGRGKAFISPEIMISQRPAEAADRAVPGHWEGDLILGLGSSAIGTLVERTTRFTLLLYLPRMAGHGHEARVKNGPALAGHGAEAVRDAISRTIVTLPEQLRRSLTWDQGAEMAQHARLKIEAGVRVYFCDPHSPWQRGTNENTNGLLRQYFPKGTDLSMHSANEIAAVAAALNSRPRKTLDWKTPAEALDRFLLSADKDRVATTA